MIWIGTILACPTPAFFRRYFLLATVCSSKSIPRIRGTRPVSRQEEAEGSEDGTTNLHIPSRNFVTDSEIVQAGWTVMGGFTAGASFLLCTHKGHNGRLHVVESLGR